MSKVEVAIIPTSNRYNGGKGINTHTIHSSILILPNLGG
jgi:hypothetical protein